MKLEYMKKKTHHLEPSVFVGKAGLTDSIIDEITVQLKRKKMVKIRLLKTAKEDESMKSVARDLAAKTGSQLVKQVGNTITLYLGAQLQ